MGQFIAEYWIDFLFGLIIAGFSFGGKKLYARIKRFELVEKGVQALLRHSIIQEYNKRMESGYCPIYALDSIDLMYEEYHNLGGNGTITKLVNELKELPHERKNHNEN